MLSAKEIEKVLPIVTPAPLEGIRTLLILQHLIVSSNQQQAGEKSIHQLGMNFRLVLM
jgi:hypothetical protein